VLFSDATRALAADGLDVFLEIGPHPVLSSAMAESLRASASGDGSDGEGGSGGDPPPRVLSTLRRTTPELRTLLGTLGALYAAGVRPHWAALHPTRGRVVALPPYPWQRESYWEESLGSRSIRLGGESHPLLGRRLEVAEPGWQSRLRSRDAAYLPDHRIDGLVVFPGAAYVEMGLAAARLHLGAERSIEIEGVEFEKALFLSDDVPTALQTLLDPESLGFQVFGRTGEQDDRWTRHARGRLVPLPASAGAGAGVDGATQIDLDALRAGSRRELSSGECYRRLHELGYHFGPTFQNIARAWQGEGEGEGDCLAHIRAHQRVEAAAGAYHVHPSMLDAAFQTLIVSAMDSMKATYLPVRIDRMVFHAGRAGTELWVHARLGEVSESRVEGSLEAYDAAGRLVFAIEGVHARSVEAGQGAGGGSLARLLYDLEWEPVELRAPEADALPGLHVIFADPGGVGDAAALRLRQEGQRCVLVRPRSGAPMEIKGDVVHLDPGSAEDFTRLFREVADPSGARPLLTVLHLWNLDGPAATDGRGGANGRPARGHEGLDTAGLRGAQITGSESLLHVVRSLTEVGEAPRLWVVTCGAVATGPSDPPVAVAQAPAWGLTRAILHQEYTELAGGLVDLDAAPETGAKLAGALLDAIGGAPPGEDQLAIRHGDCLAVRAARSRTGAEDAPRPRLRPDATYLITGGFGGLGPLAARWMVERGARRLILMGRTPLPGRRLWSQVEPGTREAGMVAVVREIEALGASVHAAAVDVSDEVALGAWLEDFQQQGLPSIRGVLHAAGVATPELVEQLSTEEFRAGMAPKVAGAWNLHRALEDSPLDFFVLFSSIAGLGASLGTSSYAAGNAFMDALAHHRRALGRPATSIVWGAFGEVGMVVYLESEHGMLSRGVGLMPASTVRDGLDAALAADLTQPVIASLDWSLIDRANYPVGAPAMFRALVESASEAEAATDGGREGRGASILAELQGAKGAAARREVLERFLVDLTARMLGLRPERLESTRPLVDLGLDSMIAVDLKNRVDAALGVSPPLVELFRNATVSSIADNLLARLSSSTGAPPPSENPAGSQREAPAETSARPTTGAVRTESAAGLPDAGVPPVPPGPAGPPDALGTA
jgi:acyl transferase domain-containing protein/acyl carrier protein